MLAQSPPADNDLADLLEPSPTVVFPCHNPPSSSVVASFLATGNLEERGIKTAQKCDVMMFHRARRATNRAVGPQTVAMEFASANKQYYLVQYVDQRAQAARVLCTYRYAAFGSLKDVDHFIDSRNQASKFKCALFEVIPSTYACRAYFDIDFVVPIPPTEEKLLDFAICCHDEVMNLARKHGATRSQAAVVVKDRSCMRNEQKYKISFHCILPFVMFSNNHCGALKEWARELDAALVTPLSKIMGIPVASVVDLRVYTKNRLMSCLKTIKPSTDLVACLEARQMKTHQISFSSDRDDDFELSWISIPPGTKMEHCFFAQKKDNGDAYFDDLLPTQCAESPLPSVVAPASTLQDTTVPTTEMAMAVNWAERYYHLRKALHPAEYFRQTEFNTGSATARGSRIFFSVNCDTFCAMAKRCHRGDDAGTQTSYEVNLLTGSVRQNCFSCGNRCPWERVSMGAYDIFNVLCSGSPLEMAHAMKEEFKDGAFVQVYPVTRQRESIWLWDEYKKCNGAYNNIGYNSKLWVEGNASYLKIGVVAPWIQRKFDLITEEARHGGGASEQQKKKIEKAKKRWTSLTQLTHVTDCLKVLLCDRSSCTQSFQEKLNRAETFIATNDGCVVNLTTCTKEARESSHFFSLETNFSLLDRTPENEERIKKFDDFVLLICANDAEKKHYLQKIFGYCLTTNHDDRKIYMHVGCGSNGKTSMDECFQKALGPFHKNVRSGFLVDQERNSGNASPDLMGLMAARFGSLNETHREKKVDGCRLKLVADGGTLSGRQLYEEEKNFNLFCKMMVWSNYMLKLPPSQDIALEDRIVAISYVMRFVPDPDPSQPHEVLKQPSIVAALKDDSDAVGSWLCHGAMLALQDIKENGAIVIPPVIQKETKAELDKQNVLATFLKSSGGVEFHPAVINRSATERTTRDISRTEWVYDKQDLWAAFKHYNVAFGSQDKFDMATFNGCLTTYFANNNIGVTSFNHADAYYWLGIRKAKSKGNEHKGTIEGLYGLTWVNKDP